MKFRSMKTNLFHPPPDHYKCQPEGAHPRRICFLWILPLLMVLPGMVHAQFDLTTNIDNTITIKKYTGSGGDVVIPSSTNGMPVDSIGFTAFKGTSVTNVTIPDSVTYIANSAFYYCTRLTGITIPPSITNFGLYSFIRTGLTNVTIPDGVTGGIADHMFDSCYSLTNVTIGNSVPSIGQWAFYSCQNLTNISPASWKVLGLASGRMRM